MGNGGVGGTSPFQGALWNEARTMIQRRPQGLTDDQILRLVDRATADTTVTPQEQQLLQAVADPENVRKIVQAMRASGQRAGFEVQGLNFNTQRAAQVTQNLRAGVAGQQIGNSYDQTAERRQTAIQQQGERTRVGPGQALTMATPAGRDAILDSYGQLMGSQTYGPQACGAASLMALAINAGPQALGTLARLVRNDRDYDPDFAAMCDRFAQPNAQFTLADLSDLQDALLERMQVEENNRHPGAGGAPAAGLSSDAILRFIGAHQAELAPLFAGGGRILAIDNSGDGALDHFVAYVPRNGQDRIYEPYQTQSGHHLITDQAQMLRYAQAIAR